MVTLEWQNKQRVTRLARFRFMRRPGACADQATAFFRRLDWSASWTFSESKIFIID
jgi:hypothetical protein